MKVPLAVVLLFLFILKINCAKILAVFPVPSISHQVVFRPLTQELARRGHEVIVITPDPVFAKNESPDNLTEIDIHDVSYEVWRRNLALSPDFGKTDSIFEQVEALLELYPKFAEVQLNLNEVQDLIRNAKFDVLLLEACSREALIFSHIVKAPVIQVSSMGMAIDSDHAVGTLSHPLLHPNGFAQQLYNHTFWEKVDASYKHRWIHRIFEDTQVVVNEMFQRVFGNDAPPLHELYNNIDLLFLNTHPIWTDNQPWPPNVVSIWGIYKQPSKEIPQDIKNYLDSSRNGVIFFSFGTNVRPSMLPQERIEVFIKTLAQLPYDVLWKWDEDEMPEKPHNIKIFKWLPQAEVLKHPKIKLFITQGGLQSTDEAINAEVPLIGIPMLGDQWYNVEKYVHHKIGLKLDFPSLTEDKLRTAIERVIQDPSFKQHIAKLRTLMKDQPQSALERAVWWTEYVLRHGGAKHLRARGANMPWTQYYEIDFLVKSLLILFLILVTISTLIYLSVNNGFKLKIKIT